MFAPILPRPIMPICIMTPLSSRDMWRLRSCLFEAHSQPVHRCRHLLAFSKHRGSRDQHIRARIHHQRRGARVNTTVNLEITASLALIYHPTHTPYLGQCRVDEPLVSEARVDRHDEHLIHVPKDFFQHCRGSRGIDGHAGTLPESLDALYCAVQIDVAFPVDEEAVRTCLD